MDVKTFATELARSLTRRGIRKELAVKHAVSLVRTFDEEDLREITSYTSSEDFADLSDSLAELIKEKDDQPMPSPETAAVNEEAQESSSIATGEIQLPRETDSGASLRTTRSIPVVRTSTASTPIVTDGMKTREVSLGRKKAESVDGGSTRTFESVRDSGKRSVDWTEEDASEMNIPVVDIVYPENDQEIYLDEEKGDSGKVALTKRGKAFFWTITICTSPLTLAIALLVLGVFALGIVTVCALIVAALILVCGEAVIGSGFTLVGIIYGVIQIIEGNLGIGIYEIGIGISAGGLSLALGILTYNFAVLVLPYVLRQLITFEGYCLGRVGPMINRFREECNRL